MPWPDSPDERFPWELGEEGTPPVQAAPDEQAAPAGAFETLTVDELEEFERFERQRHDRGRTSS
jgi:hypothetical protein